MLGDLLEFSWDACERGQNMPEELVLVYEYSLHSNEARSRQLDHIAEDVENAGAIKCRILIQILDVGRYSFVRSYSHMFFKKISKMSLNLKLLQAKHGLILMFLLFSHSKRM